MLEFQEHLWCVCVCVCVCVCLCVLCVCVCVCVLSMFFSMATSLRRNDSAAISLLQFFGEKFALSGKH